jgi:hypothetical protein
VPFSSTRFSAQCRPRAFSQNSSASAPRDVSALVKMIGLMGTGAAVAAVVAFGYQRVSGTSKRDLAERERMKLERQRQLEAKAAKAAKAAAAAAAPLKYRRLVSLPPSAPPAPAPAPPAPAPEVEHDDEDDGGMIDIECDCLRLMKSGPCGEIFIASAQCFNASKTRPRGADCMTEFQAMTNCFAQVCIDGASEIIQS